MKEKGQESDEQQQVSDWGGRNICHEMKREEAKVIAF